MSSSAISVAEFFHLHSILMSIVERKIGNPPPVPDSIEQILSQKDSSQGGDPVPEAACRWLELLDLASDPYLLRTCAMIEGGVGDPGVRAAPGGQENSFPIGPGQIGLAVDSPAADARGTNPTARGMAPTCNRGDLAR